MGLPGGQRNDPPLRELRIPAVSTVEDWPFGYDELEPYYDVVEHEIGVSGKAGNLRGDIDPAGNTFEGPRQRDFPMSPLRWTSFLTRMADTARSLGWHPFPGPAAINTERYEGRPGCTYHGFCSRGGCPVNAKNSTLITTIPKALDTGNLTIVTRAHVTTIEVDADGRATGVNYVIGRDEYFQPARVVLVASYTYENIRLLLLSKSTAYPAGLSNNRGQVGGITSATTRRVCERAVPLRPQVLVRSSGPRRGRGRLADDNFDHSGLDFVGGGSLWARSDGRPISAASMDTFGRARSWGSGWKRFIRENSDRSHFISIQKTTLPYEDNYVDLDPEVTDPLGFRCSYHGPLSNERAGDSRVHAGPRR